MRGAQGNIQNAEGDSVGIGFGTAGDCRDEDGRACEDDQGSGEQRARSKSIGQGTDRKSQYSTREADGNEDSGGETFRKPTLTNDALHVKGQAGLE